VTILIGATGSGKSTQSVPYLADSGMLPQNGAIVCTQPRKVS
jgi:HrpA-like RNA helicase